jgi:hypothetical protein
MTANKGMRQHPRGQVCCARAKEPVRARQHRGMIAALLASSPELTKVLMMTVRLSLI